MADTLAFDHVHLSAPSPADACAWYIAHMGAVQGATADRVLVGEQLWLIFYAAPSATPSRLGVIDSIGFAVPDATQKITELTAAGCTLVEPVAARDGRKPAGVVEDPYGIRLTIAEDADASGFRFAHLRLADPAAAIDWYIEMFGGARGRMDDAIDGVRYGNVWLVMSEGTAAPSEGHAIDHLAWRAPHLDSKAQELRTKRVPFTMEPRQFNETVRISFVEGPAGTRIEVLQRGLAPAASLG